MSHYDPQAPVDRAYAKALDDLSTRLQGALDDWPEYNSAHEGLGLLAEEVSELSAEVFKREGERDTAAMRSEAIDVAVVALRIAAGCEITWPEEPKS